MARKYQVTIDLNSNVDEQLNAIKRSADLAEQSFDQFGDNVQKDVDQAARSFDKLEKATKGVQQQNVGKSLASDLKGVRATAEATARSFDQIEQSTEQVAQGAQEDFSRVEQSLQSLESQIESTRGGLERVLAIFGSVSEIVGNFAQVAITAAANWEGLIAAIAIGSGALSKLLSSFGLTSKAVDSVTKKFSILSATIGLLRNPLFLATTAMVGFNSAAAAFTRDLQIASDRTTVGTEELQKYNFQLSQLASGADLEDLQEGLLNISERFAEATRDAGAIRDAMQAIGLSQDQIVELNFAGPEAQLEAIRTAFQGLATDSERIFRARELFGEDGLRILDFITATEDQLAKLEARQVRLGIVVPEDVTDNLDKLTKQYKELGQVTEALAIQTGSVFTNVSTEAFGLFTDLFSLVGGPAGIGAALRGLTFPISEPIALAIRGARGLVEIFDTLQNVVIQRLVGGIQSAAEATQTWLGSVGERTGFSTFVDNAETSLSKVSLAARQAWIEFRLLDDSLPIAEVQRLTAAEAQLEQALSGTNEQARALRDSLKQAAAESGQVERQFFEAIEAVETLQGQLVKEFGVKLETETAVQKLARLDAAIESLRDKARLQVVAEFPDLSGAALEAEVNKSLDNIEKKYNETYDAISRQVRLETLAQVDQFEKVKAGYNEIDRVRFESASKIKEFSRLRAQGEISTDEISELIALEESAANERIDAIRQRNSRQAEAEAERVKRIQEAAANEAKALADTRSTLLAEVTKFGEIDKALADTLSKLQDTFNAGGLNQSELDQLTLNAEVMADLNREEFDRELAALSAAAGDVTRLEITASVTNAGEAVNQLGDIFDQIEAERAEAQANFDATFKFDPNAGQELADSLNSIDTAGADAYKQLFEQLDDFEAIADINLADGIEDELRQLEGPINSLKDQLAEAIGAGDVEQQRRIQLLIETVEDQGLQDLLEATRTGYDSVVRLTFDEDSSNLDEVLAQIARIEREGVKIKIQAGVDPGLAAAAAAAEADPFKVAAVGADTQNQIEQADTFAALENIEAKLNPVQTAEFEDSITDAFDRILANLNSDIQSILQTVNSAGEGIGTGFSDSLKSAFGAETGGAIASALDTALPLFGEYFSERAAREQQQLQESVSAFQAAEQEKQAFAAAQEGFAAADTQADLDRATENLNTLLQRYQVTNDELAALGVNRGSSAEQIAQVVANASKGESEALRKQALAQEATARKAFEADKNFKRASVIASGIQAVMNAFATVPYPANFAAAASAGVFATQQLSAINRLTFQGAGGALSTPSGVGGAGGDIAQAGSSGGIGQVDSATDALNGRPAVSNVQIDFQGRSNITTEEAMQMVDAIREAVDEGFDVEFN